MLVGSGFSQSFLRYPSLQRFHELFSSLQRVARELPVVSTVRSSIYTLVVRGCPHRFLDLQ